MSQVSSLKIFAGISDDVVQKIINNAKKEQFLAGQIVLAEGDSSNGYAYIIEKGECEVHMKNSQITTLTEGEIFGEMALLGEEKRNATIIAKTNTLLITLSLNDLVEMINNDENMINKEIIKRMEENLERENTK